MVTYSLKIFYSIMLMTLGVGLTVPGSLEKTDLDEALQLGFCVSIVHESLESAAHDIDKYLNI